MSKASVATIGMGGPDIELNCVNGRIANLGENNSEFINNSNLVKTLHNGIAHIAQRTHRINIQLYNYIIFEHHSCLQWVIGNDIRGGEMREYMIQKANEVWPGKSNARLFDRSGAAVSWPEMSYCRYR